MAFSTMFDDRERAAEARFAKAGELQFLARRAGIAALASWAGESLGWGEARSAGYVEMVVASFLAGQSVEDVVTRVRSDLERGGKPALSCTAADVLAQAEANARARVRGI